MTQAWRFHLARHYGPIALLLCSVVCSGHCLWDEGAHSSPLPPFSSSPPSSLLSSSPPISPSPPIVIMLLNLLLLFSIVHAGRVELPKNFETSTAEQRIYKW